MSKNECVRDTASIKCSKTGLQFNSVSRLFLSFIIILKIQTTSCVCEIFDCLFLNAIYSVSRITSGSCMQSSQCTEITEISCVKKDTTTPAGKYQFHAKNAGPNCFGSFLTFL